MMSSIHELIVTLRTGLRHGVYCGYWAGLATYGPFSAIYFMVYEKWKLQCAQFLDRTVESLSMPYHLSGGVVAGSVAAAATSPIDAIKTRMQVISLSWP
jgi:hypothetical protein